MKMLVTITLIICFIFTLSSCGNDYEITPHNSEIKNENEQEKEEENEQNETDGNTDEQRENEPRDFINGFPLYIEFENDFVQSESARIFYHKLGGRTALTIAYGNEFFKIEMYKVIYDLSEEVNHLLGQREFQVDGYRGGEMSTVIYYETYMTSWATRALVLTDWNGKTFTYLLYTDREREELIVERVDIPKQQRSDQSFIDMYGEIETVTVRFFTFCSDFTYEYETENIKAANFTEEFIYYMYLHTGAIINDIWFEGNTICVDLCDYYEWTRFQGSTGVVIQMSQLLHTISSIPSAERIEFYLNGERNASVSKIGTLPIYFTEDFHVD
jgi:hypothetical protein